MRMLPRSITPRRWRSGAAWGLVLTLAGCASAGVAGASPFVWVDELSDGDVAAPKVERDALAPGDLLTIQVFNHPEISSRTRVRDDGKVSIPLLGDVAAAGTAPSDLAHSIEQLLGDRQLAVAARATVALEERSPLRVAVLGEVARPGLYPLDRDAGMAEALASAGGFTEFAHRDRIYVVRRTPRAVRIRLTYENLSQARGKAADLRLRRGDVVVIE
jgi:polysaccharide export outer membrane protein